MSATSASPVPRTATSLSRSGLTRRSVVAVALTGLALAGCGTGTTGGSAANPYGLIQPGTITAATQTGQPPFAAADASGRPAGFIIDVTNEAAKRLGLKVLYKTTSAPGALAGLTAGQYDLAASGLGVTPQRQQSVDFTKPLFWSTTVVLTTDASKATSFGAFTGKKVGVVTGSAQQPMVPVKMPGARAVAFQDENTAISQLLNGTIDAFLVGGPDATAYLKRFDRLRTAATAPVDHPTSMALPKHHPAFLAALNKEIAAMVQDGTYAKLYRRYFSTPPQPQLLTAWPALTAQFGGSK